MSRYKNNCIIKENSRGFKGRDKKISNTTIRAGLKNGLELANGNAYKKVTSLRGGGYYYDYISSKTRQEAIKEYKRLTDINSVHYLKFFKKIQNVK